MQDGNTIASLTLFEILAFLWPVILFELPRYLFTVMSLLGNREGNSNFETYVPPPFSVVIAGHNEEVKLKLCIASLKEQSALPNEIIVISDGSTDGMKKTLYELQLNGEISAYHHLELRGGKGAALNLAYQSVHNEMVISIDCDCSFDRHAMKLILYRLESDNVGAVTGNVKVRNERKSLLAMMQSLEYGIRIGIGKAALGKFDQVSCISGAFGAFRRSALTRVGGMDAVSGEDLDITLRIRQVGYRVIFSHEAICYTDVPSTFNKLVKQRFRWECDAISLRLRQHGQKLNPFAKLLQPKELIHNFDFIFFDLFANIITPFAVIWLYYLLGSDMVFVFLGMVIYYFLFEFALFVVSAKSMRAQKFETFILYLPAYVFYNMIIIRSLRFIAYTSELIFWTSRFDDFVPQKVLKSREA